MSNTFDVEIRLHFTELTFAQITKLERFLSEGLDGREWGTPRMIINSEHVGSRDTTEKGVTKEKLLDMEKKHGGKACGK